MNFKSLLCLATLLAATGVAQAFPDYTITPTPGKEFTDVQNLASFNLVFSDATSIVISDATGPYLKNENGQQISCTAFKDFSSLVAGTTVINFNSEDITSNGEWTLTIPAGILTVNGETNEVISASYTLNDPNLEVGEYPEITLVSIDPANGAELSTWGTDDENSLWKVTIKTSNDDAVNYIGWYLWDETADEYVREGNENRIDLNRYGNADDQWADGIFFSVGGETKLVAGHTYRLDLTFAGIGYNPDTNQYPTKQQIEASTELETSVYYEGLTPLQEYAEATYVGVTPDPSTTSITSDSFSFDVEYSAPAKPVAFTYSLGSGMGTASAGTWVVAEGYSEDSNGLAEKWTFNIDSNVILSSEGTLTCNIESMDNDGLYVKGNSDIDFDDIDYRITWSLNGSSTIVNTIALVAVSPDVLTSIESLSSITVTNESNLEMMLSSGTAAIWTSTMEQVRTLGDPVLSEDRTEATWTFEPIAEEGRYILMLSEGYFSIGDEGIASADTYFVYIVETPSSGSGAVFDLFPASVTPEENSTIESLSDVVLTFNDVTGYPMDGSAPKIQLYRVEGLDMEVIQELEVYEDSQVEKNDMWNPTEYTLHFTEVTEPGTYMVLIPQGVFCDGDYDLYFGEEGYANPELQYEYYIVGDSSGVESIVDGAETITVYDVNGVQILKDADVEAAKNLKSGAYIINGKKVMIRR